MFMDMLTCMLRYKPFCRCVTTCLDRTASTQCARCGYGACMEWSITTESPAKTAELIKMPIGACTVTQRTTWIEACMIHQNPHLTYTWTDRVVRAPRRPVTDIKLQCAFWHEIWLNNLVFLINLYRKITFVLRPKPRQVGYSGKVSFFLNIGRRNKCFEIFKRKTKPPPNIMTSCSVRTAG